MDIGAIVLHKLLKDKSLDAWAKLRLSFLDPAYSSLYSAINKYYSTYNCIPGFDDLEVTSRDTPLTRALASLKELEVPEVDLDTALDALIDNYTQNETLRLIDKFLDKITLMSTEEIKDSLSGLLMSLDEKTHTSETIVLMNNVNIFVETDAETHIKFPLGLNNTFDAAIGGAFRQELILLGGKRGAGKSVVCSNIVANQYEQGNTSVYFTIEMTAAETMQRMMAILAGVDHVTIRQNKLSFDEILRLARARSAMFENGQEAFDAFVVHQDRFKFEADINRNYKLKSDNQIIVIDDRSLSLAALDLHLQKIKAQFGDKFTVATVDYLNQIQVPGMENGMYEWTNQIFISKKLKEYARKYDIAIISPYQIDDSGATRFAKGILDAPDMALLLDAHSKEDNCISMETTKTRSGPPIKFTSGMNWSTLKISPVDAPEPTKKSKKEDKEEAGGKTPFAKKSDDGSKGDLPW
jgi:replicative DNA helicase